MSGNGGRTPGNGSRMLEMAKGSPAAAHWRPDRTDGCRGIVPGHPGGTDEPCAGKSQRQKITERRRGISLKFSAEALYRAGILTADYGLRDYEIPTTHLTNDCN